ncbi:MAG TPA: D-2-hydroxyacid dehydrogenase [Candidatus Binatia bacterium]|jgi:phosphoglycerate dehydrogenase-like enzyme
MTVRIAQFVHAASDVVDEAFLRDFPEVEATKADSFESLVDALDGAEILHVYNSAFTADFARLVRDKGRALKWIQFTTVGIEIGLNAGLPEGVWVTNSGDVNQRVLAGHAMALMLGVMRGFRRFEPLRAQRKWSRGIMSSHMIETEGARMIILGMGRIGQEIARKAKAFDMEVICVTRARAPAVPEIDRVVPREKLGEVLPTADVVMVAMPLDSSTKGFLSAEKIALMQETAILVNISRGKVVDEAALARTLAEGRIKGAGLDAFAEEPLPAASPFWDLPNVLMTPHVGGQGGRELWRRMSELIRENTRRYLSGAPLKHVVRTPDGKLQGFGNPQAGN